MSEPTSDPVVTEPVETVDQPPASPEVPVAEPTETVNTGASNESPTLPPGVLSSAARAHALLGHMQTIAAQLQADIERYVPAPALDAAKIEVASIIRAIL